MAAGLYIIPAGADAWASYIDQSHTALNDGWVLDQAGTDATGAFTTRATFASAATFTVAGDQTTTYVAGRRLRIVHAGGTTYCQVSSSVFGALTTVTVTHITSGPTAITTPITSLAFAVTLGGVTGNVPVLTYASTTLTTAVFCTAANSWTIALGKSLSPGTWSINAGVTMGFGAVTAIRSRIDDGTVIYASAYAESTAANLLAAPMSLSAIVATTAALTYNLSISSASTLSRAYNETPGAVASTAATWFYAVKIG